MLSLRMKKKQVKRRQTWILLHLSYSLCTYLPLEYDFVEIEIEVVALGVAHGVDGQS
jgi:hypothetical protein